MPSKEIQIIIGLIFVSLIVIFGIIYMIFSKKEAKINSLLGKYLDLINLKNDLLPSILISLKKYFPDKDSLINETITLRSQSYSARKDLKTRKEIEKSVTQKISEIIKLAIENDELKQDPTFIELSKKLSETKTKINEQKEQYNILTNKFNKFRKYLIIFSVILRIKPIETC